MSNFKKPEGDKYEEGTGRVEGVKSPTPEYTSNPRLIRAITQSISGQINGQPVGDTSNPNNINQKHLKITKNPKKSNGIHEVIETYEMAKGHLNISTLPKDFKPELKAVKRLWSEQLRGMYLAVNESISAGGAGSILTHITVNLSHEVSVALLNNKKGEATGLQQKIADNTKLSRILKNYFLVLETSPKTTRLHAHIVAAIDPKDQEEIRKALKRYSSNHNNAVLIETGYTRTHGAPIGSVEYELLQTEIEQHPQLTTWTLNKGTRRFQKRVEGVDIGIADYLAKQLKDKDCLAGKKRFSAPKCIRDRAAELRMKQYLQNSTNST